jgi:glycosyltransferase involved in cell wall biosynthesis
LRILFLNPGSQMGGAEVVLLDILASLRHSAPDVSLSLSVGSDGPFVSKARALGVHTLVLSLPASIAQLGDAAAGGPAGAQQSRISLLARMLRASPDTAAYVRHLRQTIRDLAPDIVHTNGFKMHLLAAWAAPRGIPLVWHLHDYVSARPFMGRFLRQYARRCRFAIANSESVAEDLRSVCGPGLNVKRLYNGVDLKRFSPAGPKLDLDSLSGFSPAAPEVIRVGLPATFARWKGHEVFLRAMASASRVVPLRGYIIGGPLYQTAGSQYSLEELQSLAEKFGVANRVGFTGFVDQPEAAMRALDIVVHASTEPEPFGLVIAEAMGCGRPVIVSDAGGAAELIEDRISALTHSPGDAAELARRIHELATDAELRNRLGTKARETAERRFDRARYAGELMPIYRECKDTSVPAAVTTAPSLSIPPTAPSGAD